MEIETDMFCVHKPGEAREGKCCLGRPAPPPTPPHLMGRGRLCAGLLEARPRDRRKASRGPLLHLPAARVVGGPS